MRRSARSGPVRLRGALAPLRLVVLQTEPALGDLFANARAMARARGPADLVITPELSLTGYDVRDAVHDWWLSVEPGSPAEPPLDALVPGPPTVIGLIERGDDGIPYNACVLVSDGRVTYRHRKIYLPTYGVFDEGRYFGRGSVLSLFECDGWRVAVLICEDLWHPALVYVAALSNADLIVVPAAAAGRGVVEGGPGGGTFASSTAWEELARVSARTHGVYVALANRVGVEDGVTFAGGSRIIGPDGTELAVADAAGTARLAVTLDPEEIARARRPFAHLRDEDPHLLARLLGQRGVHA